MGIEIGHQLFRWFTDLWINFFSRKFWRERLLSGANKPRRDFTDFRSVCQVSGKDEPTVFSCNACLISYPAFQPEPAGSMPSAPGTAPGTPVMLPPRRAHVQLNHCILSLAPFHWTEFGLNSVFSLSHLPQRAATHLPGWSDGENLFVTCCTIATGKRASDGLPEDLDLWVFPFCCPGAWR